MRILVIEDNHRLNYSLKMSLTAAQEHMNAPVTIADPRTGYVADPHA
jgi:hypothetical protein